MNDHLRRSACLSLLIVLSMLSIAGLSHGQPPLYRIGAPYPPLRDPRLTTDNGIPGSGYYYFRDYPYPSLREALQEYGWFGHRFQRHAPAMGTAEAPPAPAFLRVHLPEDAELWINGKATSQRGDWRRFITPPLPAGQFFGYDLEARWIEGGQEVRRARSVHTTSGMEAEIDLLRNEDNSSTLPPPRSLPAK